jgi:hypothetical protein
MRIPPRVAVLTVGLMVLVGVSWGRGRPEPADASAGTAEADLVRPPGGAGQGALTGFDEGAQLSNRDLATTSDAIVIGRATDSQPFWIDGGRNLVTLVTIAVEETLKGDGSQTVTVALPGGVDVNRKFPIAMNYPGAPRIAPDEEVFLFLVRADGEVAQSYAVTGFSQGKLSIAPGGGGVGLRAAQGADRQVRVGGGLVPLSTFSDEIRSYLAQ